MNGKILLAGIGGQGVLFAHQLLADCAIAQGYDVTGAETHGMSQRGGSVVSHLKLGDPASNAEQVGGAPLIRQGTADFLIAFNETEALRALPFIKRGGIVVLNGAAQNFSNALVRAQLDAEQISVRACDATAIAVRLGRISVANVVLLGFASTCDSFPLSRDTLRDALRRNGTRFLELNLKAFEAGVKAGNQRLEVGG